MTATLEALIDELSSAVQRSIPEAINICEKIKANIPDTLEQIQLSDEKLESLFSSLLRISASEAQPQKTSTKRISKDADDY